MEDWKGPGTSGSNTNFETDPTSTPLAGMDTPEGTVTGVGAGSAGSAHRTGKKGKSGMSANEPAADTMDKAKQGANEAVDTVKEQLAAASDKASGAAGQASDKAAAGLHSAADMLRERGGQVAGPGAATVADRIDSAASAMEGVSGEQMVSGLESMVRRNPTQALLVAAGAGFLLARATR
jgi:ElaB/YqjD/DUF883 family membrane-anchored ribosome-binding protein